MDLTCFQPNASGGFVLVAVLVAAVLASWGTWWLMRNKPEAVSKVEDAAREFDDKRRGL